MAVNHVIINGKTVVDLRNDTVSADKLLKGVTAHDKTGVKITGTMPNNGAVSGSIATKDGQYTVPQGFHNGSGKVGIASTEKAKLIPGNIKSGVEVLGVTGSYSGESINAQTKSVTPSFAQQVVQPEDGYDYLSTVTVAAIPVAYADNAAGGRTVTIG